MEHDVWDATLHLVTIGRLVVFASIPIHMVLLDACQAKLLHNLLDQKAGDRVQSSVVVGSDVEVATIEISEEDIRSSFPTLLFQAMEGIGGSKTRAPHDVIHDLLGDILIGDEPDAIPMRDQVVVVVVMRGADDHFIEDFERSHGLI